MKGCAYIVFFGFLILVSCNQKADLLKAAAEIRTAEGDFEKAAYKNGIAEAFYQFAAEKATINRGKLIHGRDSIRLFYLNAKMEEATLSWSPDTVVVSQSADLAYTYGAYKLLMVDSIGNKRTETGHFHTVWKKTERGSWKYVWD